MVRHWLPAVALAAVSVLVLALRVHAGLERVRFRVVAEPVTARESSLTIQLPDLTPLAGAPAAVVLRLTGASEPSTIRIAFDGTPILETALPARREIRVDAPVQAPARAARVEIAGDRPEWTLSYLEVANVYGFSRGFLSFVVVPRERDAFPRIPTPLLPLAFVLLVALRPRPEWPDARWSRIAYWTSGGLVLLLFTTSLVADSLTKYKVILSVPTFALCLSVLYAERTLQGIHGAAALVIAAYRAIIPPLRAGVRGIQRVAEWPRLPATVTLGLSIGLFAFAYVRGTHIAGGSDSYGYISQAELWASGRLYDTLPLATDLPADVSDWAITPLGYVPHRAAGVRGQIVPSYAPGLPLLMAAFQRMGGFDAVYLVVPVFAGVTIWLTFLLGRQVRGDLTGCFAACWLATSPPFVVASLTPMSDVPATAFWTAALVVTGGATRWSGLLAGLATALAILIRPNLAPLAAILAVFHLWRVGMSGNRRDFLGLGAFVLAAAVGVAGIGVLFTYWYGSPFKSGYGDTDYLFAFSQMWPNLQRYPRWLAATGTLLVAAAIIAPLVLDSRARKPFAWLLLSFAALVWAAYLVYIPFDTWEYLRFMLPSYPALLVLAAAALTIAVGRTLAPRFLTVILLTLLMIYGVRFEGGMLNVDLATLEARYRRVGEFVNRSFPDRAVFLALQHSGSLRLYGRREILRYDLLPEARLDTILAHLKARGRDPYLVLDKWEEEQFRKRFRQHSRLGALDWPPTAVAPGPMRVAIYDPRDRDSTEVVVTRTIP